MSWSLSFIVPAAADHSTRCSQVANAFASATHHMDPAERLLVTHLAGAATAGAVSMPGQAVCVESYGHFHNGQGNAVLKFQNTVDPESTT